MQSGESLMGEQRITRLGLLKQDLPALSCRLSYRDTLDAF